MANSHRKCKYKECGEFYRVADGLKDFCSEDHKVLQFKLKPKAKPAVKKKRVKLKTLPRLIEECAVTLQRLVRVKAAVAAGKNGMIQCVTSGVWIHWAAAQGGHYIERGRLATKLLEENVHPQSMQENAFTMKTTSGVLKYRRFMVDTYGEKFVTELELQSRQTKKYTRQEVEDLHSDFKRRLAELEAML